MNSFPATNRSQYKFDEVCTRTDVRPYILRFWESEFEEIAPIITEENEKLYSSSDLEAILAIKELLFVKKFSVNRAKLEIKKPSILVETPVAIQEKEKVQDKVQEREINVVQLKEKLEQLLAMTNSIKQLHNWN